MLKDLTLFAMAQKRMDWVAKRQEVLAQNIANADTPKYQSRDLKPLDFKSLIEERPPVAVAVTDPRHIQPAPPHPDSREVTVRKPFETAPDGNGVVMEEQMEKLGEAKSQYEMAATMFQKHMRMLKVAIGRGGGG